MCTIHIGVGDLVLWENHLTNISGGCGSSNFQVIIKILELVIKISRILNQVIESITLVFPLLLFILRYFCSCFLFCNFFVVLELGGAYLCECLLI